MENDRIKVLPDGIANQIAAGEVVGRPASVVKELMENAVDAGSTSVTVNYREGGRASIQVVDNGCGMSQTDARLAFERHATSKIREASDLYRLRSFGFRGEALPSIASVAEVELRTRTPQDELGTQVTIHGGRFVSQEPVQTPQGTQFMVRNLFYNTPARRRFLKEPSVEARHIRTEYLRVALCNPSVAFSLYDSNTLVSTLPPANLRQRIVAAIGGKDIAKNLLEVSVDTSMVRVEGFVGRPSAAKKTNKEQYMFVNGRYFSSPYFRKAVLQAYEKLVAPDTQPSYFLYITIDPERIDVNVHPQKTEIKFDDEQALWQIFNAAVRETLGKLGVVPMMDFEMDRSIEIPVARKGDPLRMPDLGVRADFNPFDEESGGPSVHAYPAFAPKARRVSDWEELYEVDSGAIGRAETGFGTETVPPTGEGAFDEIDGDLLEFIDGTAEEAVQTRLDLGGEAPFRGVLPWGGRYCATAVREGLAVVDLLRARECVLYERYLNLMRNGDSATQRLLFPETVVLPADELAEVRNLSAELEAMGFEFSVSGTELSVSGVPADFPAADTTAAIREAIAEFRDRGAVDAGRRERLCAVMARHGASSFRTVGGVDEAARMLEELFGCARFNYTPSGAPVMTFLTGEEMAKRLK